LLAGSSYGFWQVEPCLIGLPPWELFVGLRRQPVFVHSAVALAG